MPHESAAARALPPTSDDEALDAIASGRRWHCYVTRYGIPCHRPARFAAELWCPECSERLTFACEEHAELGAVRLEAGARRVECRHHPSADAELRTDYVPFD